MSTLTAVYCSVESDILTSAEIKYVLKENLSSIITLLLLVRVKRTKFIPYCNV